MYRIRPTVRQSSCLRPSFRTFRRDVSRKTSSPPLPPLHVRVVVQRDFAVVDPSSLYIINIHRKQKKKNNRKQIRLYVHAAFKMFSNAVGLPLRRYGPRRLVRRRCVCLYVDELRRPRKTCVHLCNDTIITCAHGRGRGRNIERNVYYFPLPPPPPPPSRRGGRRRQARAPRRIPRSLSARSISADGRLFGCLCCAPSSD